MPNRTVEAVPGIDRPQALHPDKDGLRYVVEHFCPYRTRSAASSDDSDILVIGSSQL